MLEGRSRGPGRLSSFTSCKSVEGVIVIACLWRLLQSVAWLRNLRSSEGPTSTFRRSSFCLGQPAVWLGSLSNKLKQRKKEPQRRVSAVRARGARIWGRVPEARENRGRGG